MVHLSIQDQPDQNYIMWYHMTNAIMIIWPLIRPPTTRLRTRNESWKLKSRRWRRSWRPTALEAFAGSDHRHFLSEYHHTRAGSSYQRNLIIKTSPSIDSSWWQLLLHNPRSTCSSLASLSPPSTPLCMRPESAATERWWSSSWLSWSSSWW